MTLKVERRADGQAVYTTTDGDMVDQICARFYGREWRTTEAVLEANPGLAGFGPVLASGVPILLPEISPEDTSRQNTINLFD